MHRAALAIEAMVRKDLGLENFDTRTSHILSPEEAREIAEKLKIAVVDD